MAANPSRERGGVPPQTFSAWLPVGRWVLTMEVARVQSTSAILTFQKKASSMLRTTECDKNMGEGGDGEGSIILLHHRDGGGGWSCRKEKAAKNILKQLKKRASLAHTLYFSMLSAD